MKSVVIVLVAILWASWTEGNREEMKVVVEVTHVESLTPVDARNPQRFNLSAEYSSSGMRLEVEGRVIKVNPKSLCKLKQEQLLNEQHGFIAAVQLQSPSHEPRDCHDVLQKAENAIKLGAIAVLFDVADNFEARKQLMLASPAVVFARPLIIVKGGDAYKLRHHMMVKQILHARILRSSLLRSDVGLAQRFYDIAIFLLFFLLMILILLGLLIKLKWQHRKQNSLMTVTKTIVRRLATRNWKPRSQGSINSLSACAICLEEYKTGAELRLLPCSHEFHRKCVDPWLVVNRTCPLCLFNIVDGCWEKHSSPRGSYDGETPRSLSGHSTTAAQIHHVPLLVRSESYHDTPTAHSSLLNCNGTFSDSRLDTTANLQHPHGNWRSRAPLLGYRSVPYSLHDPPSVSCSVVTPSPDNYQMPRYLWTPRTTQSGIAERQCTLDVPKLSPIIKVHKNSKVKSTDSWSSYYTSPGRQLKIKQSSEPPPHSSDSSTRSLVPAVSSSSLNRKYCSLKVPEAGPRFYDEKTPSEWFISSNESDGYSTDVSDTRTEDSPMLKKRTRPTHSRLRSYNSVPQHDSSSKSESEEEEYTPEGSFRETGINDSDPTGTFLSSLIWNKSSNSVTPNATRLCSNLTLDAEEESPSRFVNPTAYPSFLFCYDNCAPVPNGQGGGDSSSHPNIYSTDWPLSGMKSFSASAPASIVGEKHHEKIVCPILIGEANDDREQENLPSSSETFNEDDSSSEKEIDAIALESDQKEVESPSSSPDKSSAL